MKKLIKIFKRVFIWNFLSIWGLCCPKCGSKNIKDIGTYIIEVDTTFPEMGDYSACQDCGCSW